MGKRRGEYLVGTQEEVNPKSVPETGRLPALALSAKMAHALFLPAPADWFCGSKALDS